MAKVNKSNKGNNKPPYRKFKGSDTKRMNRDKEMADDAVKDVRDDLKRGSRKRGTGSMTKVSSSNPFQWYNAFPQVITDAGMIPFAIPSGSKINVFNDVTDTTGIDLVDSAKHMRYPGVMSIMYVPGIGWSEDKSSPINRAATRIFTYLRSGQKAAKDYDSQDMMMMIVALDSCYSFHELLKRTYGQMNLFSPVNKYLPRTLVESAGFDFDDLQKNLSDFRMYINNFAISLGSYTVPGNIDLFKRHAWMNQGMYADRNDAKAQIYQFVPQGFWKYDNTVTTGSQLSFIAWTKDRNDDNPKVPKLHTFEEVKAFGQALLLAILGDEDAAFISGDLLAAFGESSIMRLEETVESYRILPAYDETVLSQIQNATFIGSYTNADLPENVKITQNPSVNAGAILYKPSCFAQSPYFAENRLLNSVKDFPTPEEVVEMTRLTCTTSKPYYISEGSTNRKYYCDVIPADLCTYALIGHMSSDATVEYHLFKQAMHSISGWPNNSVAADVYDVLSITSPFDWAPQIVTYMKMSGSLPARRSYFEVDNVTAVSQTQLAALHEAAFVSLFNVPEMAFTNK